jgi:hypothetical protein
VLREVIKQIPDRIVLPVRQWSLDNIIAIDYNGLTCNLYRVDSFDFSDGVSFTEFTLNIDYPDSSKTGKDVMTEIQFIDTGMPPLVYINTFEGSRITLPIPVLNNLIQGNSTRIRITSYLLDNPGDMTLEVGMFASRNALLITGTTFAETTDNPWISPDIFTLVRGIERQVFTVSFPPKLNIRMYHDNFTNNRPLITWNQHPDASHGYYVLVLIENKHGTGSENNNSFFRIAYSGYTKDTQIRLNTSCITFTNTYTSAHTIPPKINKNDLMLIEVYVLDGSGILNTQTQRGAYLMNSTLIVR